MHVRLACAALLVAFASSAAAAPITFTDIRQAAVRPVPGTAVTAFSVPGYDPLLPPLESVTISLSVPALTVTGLRVTNPETATASFGVTFSESYRLELFGPTFGTAFTSDATSVTLPPGASVPITFDLPAATTGDRTSTNPAILDFFTRFGPVPLNVLGQFAGQTELPGNPVFGSPNPAFNELTLSVTYTPTAVPEPATFVLVGLTVAAGAGLQRYRRQRAARVTDH